MPLPSSLLRTRWPGPGRSINLSLAGRSVHSPSTVQPGPIGANTHLVRKIERHANTTLIVGQDPDRQALAFFARHDGLPVQVSDLDGVPQLVYGTDI
jgi:hypothetical protein